VWRATIVGVSREDLEPETDLDRLANLLGPAATLILTDGPRGGLLVATGPAGTMASRRTYPAIPARAADPTGAGDAFLAAFLAARLEPRLVGGRTSADSAARLAATVASLVSEASGIDAVPDRAGIRRRLRDPAQART
jgi:sugar/nucleoside kinase (ribokinase family)